MKIRGMGKLRRVVQRLKHKLAQKTLILLYHRVAEVNSDPWSLCVTPSHFAEQLAVLQKFTRPTPLQQLSQVLEHGKRSSRAVIITFDDGYADNLYNAKPLLERYDIPATVFVTSGCLELKQEFWWDELERVFLQPKILPDTLHLRINGSSYQWELGKSADYSEDAYQRHRLWRVEEQDAPTSRHSLYYSLWQLLRLLPVGERRQVLDELLVWAGADLVSRPTHRCLTAAEVSALGQGGLIEVGSHAVSHPLLSTLSTACQREEIQQSKARLEDIVGYPITSFAYPHGDYTAETVSLVRAAGFASACSTVAEPVRRRADYFQLPRFVVEDWDGEEFARRLEQWFHD